MKAGDKIRCRVTRVEDNGIYLTHGGRSGLVRVVELTWKDTEAPIPARFARAGDELEVVVLSVGPGSFGASIKHLDPSANPWLSPQVKIGTRLPGVVRSIRDFGAFVDLDVGLVALVREHPHLELGDACEVELTRVDGDARKLEGRLVGP